MIHISIHPSIPGPLLSGARREGLVLHSGGYEPACVSIVLRSTNCSVAAVAAKQGAGNGGQASWSPAAPRIHRPPPPFSFSSPRGQERRCNNNNNTICTCVRKNLNKGSHHMHALRLRSLARSLARLQSGFADARHRTHARTHAPRRAAASVRRGGGGGGARVR